MNFFQQMATSIYQFRKYPQLINAKFSKVLSYIVIFTAIISIINFMPIVMVYKQMGGISGIINKYVPDFKIENGKLFCDPIDFDDQLMKIKVYIDCNEETTTKSVEGYSAYLIADSDKMIVGNTLENEVIAFSQFNGMTIDKSSIINFFNAKKVKFALGTIFLISSLISIIISTAVSLLFITLLAHIINMWFIKARMSFSEFFKLSVYVKTFPSIVMLILGFVGITGVSLLYYGLVITYIYLALKNIKKQEAIIIAEIQ